MSNFYKPSYSRGQKRSAVYSRQGGNRNMKKDNKIFMEQKIKEGAGDLETDQNIMLHRRNVFTAQNFHDEGTQDLIKTTNLAKKQPNTRFNQTAKEGFRKNIQRPQSKQQPRIKGWNTSGIIKSTLPQTNRPQTSKGQRTKLSYKQKFDDIAKRKTSQENEDFRIMKLTNEIQRKKYGYPSSSASSRKGTQSNRLEFKTSIDPEFLSLFAN